jgi:hypothetical protein
MGYVELHASSAFSFLRGGSSPEALIATAAGLDLPGIALCDRNGLYGVVRAHMAAKSAGLRAWVGFKQIGVPYVRPERMFGVTTNNLLRNLDWARKGILSFSYVPLDLITWLALCTVGGSFVAAIIQILLKIFFPGMAPQGFPTLIVLILFLGGIQLLCLAIIGSYLAHIYDEVKRRPPFVVESILNDPRRKLDKSV